MARDARHEAFNASREGFPLKLVDETLDHRLARITGVHCGRHTLVWCGVDPLSNTLCEAVDEALQPEHCRDR
jgi:hypothetical protein